MGDTSSDLEGIKALLDAHLTNLRSELVRLGNYYDSINKTVQNIERDTNVAIAGINKDIANLNNHISAVDVEIKAIKQRVEINEDVQQGKWAEQEVVNSRQDDINKLADKKDNRITGLILSALAAFITLAISTLWNYVTRK